MRFSPHFGKSDTFIKNLSYFLLFLIRKKGHCEWYLSLYFFMALITIAMMFFTNQGQFAFIYSFIYNKEIIAKH